MVLKEQKVKIAYIHDRNSELAKWNGYSVKKPIHANLAEEELLILMTLVVRHDEMEEYLRHQGFSGKILCLDEILSAFHCNNSK